MKEFVVKVPTYLDSTTLHDIIFLSTDAICACDNWNEVSVIMDFGDLRFVRPTGLVTVIAIMRYLAWTKQLTKGLFLPPRDSKLKDYLTRIGFNEMFNFRSEYHYAMRDSTGRFREVVELTSENQCNEVVGDLVEILKSQMSLSDRALKATEFSLLELMENVFHHANSPINGIVCAQTYPLRREVEFALVDCGRGFRQSLADNPELSGQFQTTCQAIQLALDLHVTGRPLKNSGTGLFFTSELVKINGGRMSIYSEDGLLELQGQRVSTFEVSKWQGAIVSVLLHLDREIDHVALFNQYAPPENAYEFFIK